MTKHPFLDFPHPIAFAHRGGSLEAEENTMAAFVRAFEMGFTHVELDVHITRDGEVVVHHDPTLERICGDGRAIAEMTWRDLARVRTKGGAAIPRLAEVFEALPELRVNIEVKSDGAGEAVAAVIRQAGALRRVNVGSFHPEHTAEVRRALGPDLSWAPSHGGTLRIWLKGWGVPMAITGSTPKFTALQVPVVFRGIRVVTPRFVRAAAARGIDVHVWTVDDALEMERLLDMGVRGIMSDAPSVLKQVLQARGGVERDPSDRAVGP